MKFTFAFLATCFLLLTCMPLRAQDANDCFLQDFEEKIAEIPASEQAQKSSSSPTVTVTFNAADTVGKVSKYIYGNNANPYMSPMVDQPALIDYITRLSPNIIRFPGGNLSSLYFWNSSSGIPPGAPDSIVDGGTGQKIPPGYWYGRTNTNWSASLDNYYTMLDMTGNTGMITINYGFARYGTSQNPVAAAAHYAADWVRYDDSRTKFWEIGNESFGSWQAGYRIDVGKNKDGQPAVQTGALYGQHFKVFADSMRKAAADIGSTIYIGAQLFEMASGIDAETGWNAGYFSNAGDAADFYIVHSYFTPYGQNSTAAVVLNSGNTAPPAMMNFIRSVTARYMVQMKPLALTEWNIFAQGSKQACSFVNGMLASITLGELAKNGFSMASRWDLANGYDNGNDYGMFGQNDETPVKMPKWNPRPAFFYMYYFQKYFGDHVVSSSVTGSPNVLAYASTFGTGHAGVVVVNKGTTDQVVSLNPAQYGYGDHYYIFSLTGGTDNGEFSQSVSVNDEGPTNAEGGPIGVLSSIPAREYASQGGIFFESPARSVQYILLEPGSNVGIKNRIAGRIPDGFILHQNYPNPFNPQTVISYSLPKTSSVTLRVFDVMGREVATLLRNERMAAGSHQSTFNATNLPSGVYFYTLQAGAYKATKKMVVVK